MDDLRYALKKLPNPLDISTTYEVAVPLIEHLPEFKALEDDEARRSAFAKFVKRQRVRVFSAMTRVICLNTFFRNVSVNIRMMVGLRRVDDVENLLENQRESVIARKNGIVIGSAKESETAIETVIVIASAIETLIEIEAETTRRKVAARGIITVVSTIMRATDIEALEGITDEKEKRRKITTERRSVNLRIGLQSTIARKSGETPERTTEGSGMMHLEKSENEAILSTVKNQRKTKTGQNPGIDMKERRRSRMSC